VAAVWLACGRECGMACDRECGAGGDASTLLRRRVGPSRHKNAATISFKKYLVKRVNLDLDCC
jgi:hypothetical protein